MTLRVVPTSRRGDLALVVAALCFGTTFVVVQDAVGVAGPVPFIAVRFLLSALVLWPLARRRPATPGELRSGLLGGGALVTGYLLQTVGLQYTGSATSAFITYLLVVFVPLLGIVVLRRRPHRITVAGIAVAVVGLVLLTEPGGSGATSGLGRGELLTLGCALAFAAHVVILGETSRHHDPIRLATIQVTVVGVVCLVPGFWLGGYRMPASALAAAGATGLLATACRPGAPDHGPADRPSRSCGSAAAHRAGVGSGHRRRAGRWPRGHTGPGGAAHPRRRGDERDAAGVA